MPNRFLTKKEVNDICREIAKAINAAKPEVRQRIADRLLAREEELMINGAGEQK